MKIVKFGEFILEMHDTPESYGDSLLTVLKKKIDKMFEFELAKEDGEMDIKKAKSKISNDKSFKGLGLRLESSEVSKYSKQYDSLTVKFSDDNNTYTLIIMLNTEDIVKDMQEKEEEDFNIKDIKKCDIKFKKYDLDTFEVLGQISKSVEVDKVDEEFIIELKIEIDDMFGDEDEEFKIETE
jgi:hypothetical protein